MPAVRASPSSNRQILGLAQSHNSPSTGGRWKSSRPPPPRDGIHVRLRRRRRGGEGVGGATGGAGRWAVGAVCWGLVYYHCAVRRASTVSLAADVLLVLLCSLSILGLLFRHLHILAPVDPLEWQISQETNSIVASLANTIGAAESVLRVAATGHDKKLFFKVVFTLYFLAALGRVVSGAAVAYAALCIFCLYMFAQSTDLFDQLPSWVPVGRDSLGGPQDGA